jgi:solute carrier family 25 S-adenosylmethionine transporter 26
MLLVGLLLCGSSPRAELSTRERLVAGGTARAVSQAVLYPADALRTLAQTRAGAPKLSDLGARTLISGCVSTSSFAYFIGALQFAVYGAALPALGPIGASMFGAAASCLVSVPQEVIKQRLITGIYPNFRTAVREISRTGPSGFYAGWLPTVSRNVPFVVVTFSTFAALEARRLRTTGESTLRLADSLQIGVLSALVAGAATQPFDVVKTRMMTQAASSAPPYTSVVDCVATMWRAEGPAAFYAGLRQRSAYSGPLWAMQFAVNAQLSRVLLRRRRKTDD